MGKFRLAVAAALVALLGGAVWASTASATNCTTQCYGYGNSRTCYTNCY